jgi:hypothetical protein
MKLPASCRRVAKEENDDDDDDDTPRPPLYPPPKSSGGSSSAAAGGGGSAVVDRRYPLAPTAKKSSAPIPIPSVPKPSSATGAYVTMPKAEPTQVAKPSQRIRPSSAPDVHSAVNIKSYSFIIL